jgi:hypothetical protein
MRNTLRVLLTSLLLAHWAGFETQAATYALDNGSIRYPLNASDVIEPHDNWFGNVFTAQAGANVITRVDLGVFTTTANSAASVALYRVTDPGGNPALGAARLYTQSFTPLTGDGTNAFLQQIALSTPVKINPGDRFLVSVVISNVIAAPPNDVYPFLLDTSGVATGSYWDRSNPNSFNLDDLSQARPINQGFVPGGFVPDPGHVFIRAVGVSENNPPVALCTNVVVSASTNCQANASVDNGSFDPDGDPLTISQEPPGPYSLGTHSVMLIVTDGKGGSNACTAQVTVIDTTPPVIVCASNKEVACGAAWDFDPPFAFDYCSMTNIFASMVSTVTNPVCGGTFTATRTWVAVDTATNVATCSQTVTVADTTPPTVVCPPPITLEAQNEHGAVANFVVSASDTCSPVSLTATPPSGSVFPIGVTTVQANAVDACSNSSTCTFTVTVLGVRSAKSNVLAELVALRASATLDQSFATKFDYVIEHLQNSLKPEYWVDEIHLQPKGGNIALNEEKLAAKELGVIIASKNCPVDPGLLQGFIDEILKADRLLAMISIQEAEAAGLNAKKIAEDLAQVAKGDEEAAAGNYANAIEHYRNAWRHALQLNLKVSRESAGSTLVRFVGNNRQTYLIQVSTNMVNWESLATCKADAEGNVSFTDPNTSKQAFRFYRVVEQ